MEKSIIFALLLTIVAQGTWAADQKVEGPWKQLDKRTMVSDADETPWIYFDNTNNEKWPGTVSGWSNSDGIGFTFQGRNLYKSKMGIFSTYKLEKYIPSYAYMKETWTFRLGCLTTKHHSTTCLYGLHGGYTDIIKLKVDFSNHYTSTTGAENLLARLTRTEQAGTILYTGDQTYSFEFDNRDGNRARSEYWDLLLTHVMESSGYKEDLDEWGAFKSISEETTWGYRKIISFNANGGSGTMEKQNIDDTGNLAPYSFTRGSYTFLGWALSPDGDVVYTDQASITATANDKGPVTLYAKWVPSIDGVMADIDAISTPVTMSSLTAIHFAREGYDDLSSDAKSQVTNYSTLVNAEVAYNTVNLIHAIGTVVYSDACKAKIDAARNAYNALNETQKALITETDLRILLTAEDNYSVLLVVAKIEAIGTVEHSEECKAKIDAARSYYDALTYEQKEILSAAYLLTLQKAEADYAAESQTLVNYQHKDGESGATENKAIYYPALPAGANKWQSVEKSVSDDKTIVIKAAE